MQSNTAQELQLFLKLTSQSLGDRVREHIKNEEAPSEPKRTFK